MRTALSLAGVAVVLLAGCTGSPGPQGGAVGSTTPPSPATTERVETPTPGCAVAPKDTVDPARDSVTPGPLPDRPGRLTAGTVREYVSDYERAYRRNLGLEEATKQFEVAVRGVEVQGTGSGYLVTVEALWWYDEADVVEGNRTATVIHADGPNYVATYYVADDRMRRAADETSDPTPPDPRTEGRFVECW